MCDPTPNANVLVPKDLVAHPTIFGGVPIADGLFGTPIWKDARLMGLAEPLEQTATQVLLPKLVETHCHLDKCYTFERLAPSGGDLAHAISEQSRDKENWTAEDIAIRATRGLNDLIQSGCTFARTHVDWGTTAEPPLAWHVLTELAPETLQCAALTGIDQMAEPEFADAVAQHVAQKGGVLGSFILYHTPEIIKNGLRTCFEQAQRHDLMLDFHVDEGIGPYHGLEMIADTVLEMGFERPILCGHAVNLITYEEEDFARIADKLARANITICALPTTNLYLQGRRAGTPDRRGLTRLRELRAAGVSICVGSDNVADAFCPTGFHDPMAALNLAVLGAHLDPPLGRWLPMITTDASRALGRDPTYMDDAHMDALCMSNITNFADLVAGRAPLKGLSV